MGVFDRNLTGKKANANFWISYSITEELRAAFKLPSCMVREPTGVRNRTAADNALKRRRGEVKAGTWRPLKSEQASSATLNAYAAEWVARRRASGVKGVGDEEQRLNDYVLPHIGRKRMTDVSRTDVKATMAKVATTISRRTGKALAPRTQREVYGALRTLFADAMSDEVVGSTPCTLKEKRGELPKKRDADPRWRTQAVFSREEATLLLTDERVTHQRRVMYALVFYGGMRVGEAAGRRWRDYDATAKPLGRMAVGTQYDDQPLKTETPREAPVHPFLANALVEWRKQWPLLYGRPATDQDFIVPALSRVGRGLHPLTRRRAWMNLQQDLKVLGLRPRRVHDTRRAFVSFALASGADKYLLRWISHGRPNADAFDAYSEPTWELLCSQISGLRICVTADTVTTQSATQRQPTPVEYDEITGESE